MNMYRGLMHMYEMLLVLSVATALLWAADGMWLHLLLPGALIVACLLGRRECDKRSRE